MSFLNNRKQGKIIEYRLSQDEGDEELYALTFRMAKALLATIEYFKWLSRHISLPDDLNSQQALNDWHDNLANRLMMPFDPLADICSRIADCIENNSGTQSAIRNFVQNDTILNEYFTSLFEGGGKPPSPITVITDTNNKLWSQCVQVVEFTDQAINQFFDIIEVHSNNLEFIKNIGSSIPFVKTAFNVLPIDSWIDTADYFLSLASELYAAGWDETLSPTASKYRLACALFCLCKSDKTITMDRIYEAFLSLLSAYTIPSLDNLANWIEAVIGIDDTPMVAYGSFVLFWGIASRTSFFGAQVITGKALEVILKVAENDANNDWETLCIDCNVATWCYQWDLQSTSGSAQGLTGTFPSPYGTIGEHVSGVGYVWADSENQDRSGIFKEFSVDAFIDTVEFEIDPLMSGSAKWWIFVNGSEGSASDILPDTVIYSREIGQYVNTIGLYMERAGFDTSPTTPIIRYKMTGQFENPFGGDNC